MKSGSLHRTLYMGFVLLTFAVAVIFLYYGLTNSDWHDFDVFYGAAKAALLGKSIYIIVGEYHLPFWYFPWTAWFYILFAVWSPSTALILYKSVTILSAILVVYNLTRYYNPDFKIQDQVLILSLLVPMSLQVFVVGQMEYILLGLILITMYAVEKKKDIAAGVLLPFLWTKPHLLIVFTLLVFWRAGKRTVIVSLVLSLLMLMLETIISPGWHLDMLRLLQAGQQRTDGLQFTTLPSMLGSRENWVGTANLPFTIILIVVAILIVWKFRSLPVMPVLSLALAASLFCAPRAYAYDLPLLIPALIWLTAKEFKSTLWIWLIAAIFPLLIQFSSATYLVILFIFSLSVYRAHNDLRQLNGMQINRQFDIK